MNIILKFYHFHSRKYAWKCHLQYGGYFVLASMCLKLCILISKEQFETYQFHTSKVTFDWITNTTQPISNQICLLALIQHLGCEIWFMWPYCHSLINMVFADVLAPIWCQDICSHHDDMCWLLHIRSATRQWSEHLVTALLPSQHTFTVKSLI